MTQLLVHSGVHWFALILRMSAENELWIRYYNGDFAAQAKTVGNTRSAASMLGFILTPIFAGLTDAYGRKPVLLLASVASVIKNVIVVLSPSARSLVISTALSTLLPGDTVTVPGARARVRKAQRSERGAWRTVWNSPSAGPAISQTS